MSFFKRLALALLGLSLVSGVARANVVYDFFATNSTGFITPRFPEPFQQLVVTNKAYQRGYLNISRSCGFQNGGAPVNCSYNSYNKHNGFVSLTDVYPQYGEGQINIRFLKNGLLTGFFNEQGYVENFYLQSFYHGNLWTTLPGAKAGTYNPGPNYYKSVFYSDHYDTCGVDSPCSLQGYWKRQKRTHVPEPSTLALLATGVMLLVGTKKRTHLVL